MIQRIQSVYLLLTTILANLFLSGNFFDLNKGNGQMFIMNIKGLFEVSPPDNYLQISEAFPVKIISLMIPLLSIFTIFLYANRKRQLFSVAVLIVLNLLLTGIMAYYIISSHGTMNLLPGWRVVIPVINLILLALTRRGIRRDEKMVRSYDRLR